MIYIFAPSGRVRETHPVPKDRPINCTFGDADLGTLYVTTGWTTSFGRGTPDTVVNCCTPDKNPRGHLLTTLSY